MNDDERQKARERMREKILNDPEAAKRFVREVVAPIIGMHMARHEADPVLIDEAPDELREGLRQGYLAEAFGELASKPPWYTDVPLLGRILGAVFGRRRKSDEP